MTDAELKSYLFADRLEQAELEQVMLEHFGCAKSEGKHTTFYREGSEGWLRIEYTKQHAIRGFRRSANYPDSDIQALRDRIRAELVDGETKVAQVTCFAYNYVTGWCRGSVRGISFQMMPMLPGERDCGFRLRPPPVYTRGSLSDLGEFHDSPCAYPTHCDNGCPVSKLPAGEPD
jgi:hypothetical protein